MNDLDTDQWLTGKEAARRLHVHPETLRQMHVRGDLGDVGVERTPKGHRRYRASDIEARAQMARGEDPGARVTTTEVACPKLRRGGHDRQCELCAGSGRVWQRDITVSAQAPRALLARKLVQRGFALALLAAALFAAPISGWIALGALLLSLLLLLLGSVSMVTAGPGRLGSFAQGMRTMKLGIGALAFAVVILTPLHFIGPLPERVPLVLIAAAVLLVLAGPAMRLLRPPRYAQVVYHLFAPANTPPPADRWWQTA